MTDIKYLFFPKPRWYNKIIYIYYNILDIPNNFYRKCKRGIQRAYRGYSDEDLWDFHGYLSTIIVDGLIWLKENKNGYPTITKEIPNNMIDYAENEKQWDNILTKMITSFILANQISKGERELYIPQLKDKDLIQEMNCLSKEENKLMQEGFKLFTKYFFSLYD